MPTVAQLIFLHAPRKDFAFSMSDLEIQAMTAHAVYQNELCDRGNVIFAGPSIGEEQTFGIIVIRGNSKEEIREMIENDPAVKDGVVRVEYRDLVASIFDDSRSRGHLRKPDSRVIRKTIDIAATSQSVWNDFTTTEGITSFMGSGANIELRVGGKYEIYFSMDAPEGSRGSEGCRILSYVPHEILSFSWNAPPQFAMVRERRTHVVLRIASLSPQSTRVTLDHLGWQAGEEWDAVYAYFDKAWQWVLDELAKKYAK